MNNMKRILTVVIALVVVAMGFSLAAAQTDDAAAIRVASLKGPTSMGLVELMHGENAKSYEFSVAGTADEIVPLLAKGDIDIALIPSNLASVLYNNTNGAVSVVGINTLGVLYIVEMGDTIQSIDDLRGQTLYSTGKGTTPEYALNYVLKQNGIDPETDLSIEYKSESTEVAAALSAGQVSLAMLPQPYVTAVMGQVEGLRTALSLTEEWDKVSPGSALITGVLVVRNDFIENHPDELKSFLDQYRASAEYVNLNPAEASVWIEELGIAKAAVAEAAIPQSHIVLITGEEMKAKVAGYLETLYDANPASVGGALPDDAFYYIP